MDIAKVRNGIATNLESIPNLQVSAYVLANPTPPCVMVLPGPRDRHAFQGGLDEREFKVQLWVGLASDVAAQKRLDEFMADTGNRSVLAALESDRTLDGSVTESDVTRDDGVQVFTREGAPSVLGCEWTLRAMAPR